MSTFTASVIPTVTTTVQASIVSTTPPTYYNFNGTDQYATHAAWNTLGRATAYPPQFAFATDNPDGNILNPVPPVTEFGRNGSSYHAGSLSNLRYFDTSPLNGAKHYQSTAGNEITIPKLALSTATIAFDFIYRAGNQVLLAGDIPILSVASNALVNGTNTTAIRLDGGGLATLVDGQHYKVEADVSIGYLDTIGGISGIGNLKVTQ